MELSEKLMADLALEEHLAEWLMELKLRNKESMKASMKLLEGEKKMKALGIQVEDQIWEKS